MKSLKTSIGSKINTPEQAVIVASEMRQFRDTIEGGFCVREVESFLSETEKRYFVLNSVPHAMSGEIPRHCVGMRTAHPKFVFLC
ncbi:MAG: hypothetical protein WDN00_03560 [Limisphaerales bacterium]